MATTIKTAISIQKTLVEQAEGLAQNLIMSRSHPFGSAVEVFMKNHQNKILLDEINQAYSDEPDPDEIMQLNTMRKPHRDLVESQW